MIGNIVAVCIAIGLFLTLGLPRLAKHLTYSAVLLTVSTINLLGHYSVISWAIPDLPIMTYVLNIVIMVTGALSSSPSKKNL